MQSVRADAPWCPSNIEFIRRINGLDIDRRRAAHRLRRELPRARPRRRLPRRAGRDAARSAPPAGDDQVQPGAHLDAGERRRHRRRVPVHLRHGRARAATSSSAARCRCGTRYRTHARRSSRARRGCCASSTRSASIPVGADELLELRDAFPHGKYSVDIEPHDVPPARLPRVPRVDRADARGVQARQQAAFDAERERWAAAGQPEFVEPPDDLPPPAQPATSPRAARPCARR